MKISNYHFLTVASLTLLLSASALAADPNTKTVRDMPDGASVTLHGTVDKVDNPREFVLRDDAGIIDIDIQSNESVVLRKGQNVTVNGSVDKDLKGMMVDINAMSVSTDQAANNPNDKNQQATAYQINSLPRNGLVRVSGRVTDVDSEKKFTIKDDTGSVDVAVKSPAEAALTEGSQVTVIGYVDTGLVSKDIEATQVIVTANASNTASTGKTSY